MIDIIEQELTNHSNELLDILLFDRTTRKNICWATDYYISFGVEYMPQKSIAKELITGSNYHLIKPRVLRSLDEKNLRTKDKAEVFTPSWVCNEQNNLIDEAWFERKDVFNIVDNINRSWEVKKDKITFPKGKTWKKYVDAKRLEISCGEAPYLVSRYDTVTGNEISISERIGLLDRKLRVIDENTDTENEWYKWVIRAYQSIYGYEYQGDNLLLARENLLYTFIENLEYKFSKKPNDEQLIEIAKIISWNIWQMDGVTMTAPFSKRQKENTQMCLFDTDDTFESDTEAIPCKIYDWRANKSVEFRSMMRGENYNGYDLYTI